MDLRYLDSGSSHALLVRGRQHTHLVPGWDDGLLRHDPARRTSDRGQARRWRWRREGPLSRTLGKMGGRQLAARAATRAAWTRGRGDVQALPAAAGGACPGPALAPT